MEMTRDLVIDHPKLGTLKLTIAVRAADGLTHNKLTLVPEFREDLANAAVQGIRKSMVRVTESFSDPAT